MRDKISEKIKVTSPITRLILIGLTILNSACAIHKPMTSGGEFAPRLKPLAAEVSKVSFQEHSALRLIATNLISVLLQDRNIEIATTTVQFSKSKSAFGDAVIRALEDAGLGIQLVSEDQGAFYVNYEKRQSETSAGPITEYVIELDDKQVKRAYVFDGTRVFPSSVMWTRGVNNVGSLYLHDKVFTEQGGPVTQFVSGLRSVGDASQKSLARSIAVNSYDFVARYENTSASRILSDTIRNVRLVRHTITPDILAKHTQISQQVLITNDGSRDVLGEGNKQVVEHIVNQMESNDRIGIAACVNIGAENELSKSSALRLLEEFLFLGVNQQQLYLMPCEQTIYGAFSQNAIAGVKLVMLKPVI